MILLVVNLLITILIFAGGYQVIQGQISPGLLITLFTYFTMLAMPTRFLAFSLIMYQRVSAAGARIFSLLEMPTDLAEPIKSISLSKKENPLIIFDNVSFSYGDKEVLSDISLKIRPGERLAILGPTGSGKSTLISLIPRFYDVNKGKIQIAIDERQYYNLSDLQLKSWREKIGFVHQEAFLFGRTISENITFGLSETTAEQIDNVMQITQLDDFVNSLPDGSNTIIGERGVTLSGGQKQRVAIARMLLRNRPIMILDDATSSLDISTEAKFQEAFKRFLDQSPIDHTVIIITQRLSTLKMVDRIILMNRGRIVEQGTHSELLKKGKIYPLLWKTQEAGVLDIKLALEKIVQERTVDEL